MSEIPEEEQRRLDYPDDYMAQRGKLWCDVYSRVVARGKNAASEAASAVRSYDSFFYPYDPTPQEPDVFNSLDNLPDWLIEILNKHGFKRQDCDCVLYMDGETELEVIVGYMNHSTMGTIVKLMQAVEALDGNEGMCRVENAYNTVTAERFITSCRQFNSQYKKQRGE